MASNRESGGQGHKYSPAIISDAVISDTNIHQGDNNYYYLQETTKSNCRDALLLKDPFIHKETLKSEKGRRAPGTCEWIRENEIYKSWLAGDEQCLWICGGPGKGKTMLSIFLTEELKRKRKEALLFFFCVNGDKDYNNAAAVLRGLAYQLLTKYPSLSNHVASYFETQKHIDNTLSSPETLWMVLKTLLQAPELGTVLCVLDGLDECDENSIEKLVRLFRDFYSPSDHTTRRATRNLKLVIVSRKINGLDVFPQVRLDPDNNSRINHDIKQFISASTQELPRLPGFDDDFRRNIENTLLSRSEGTFLWIGFVIYELSRSTTCTEMIDILNALPRGLPGMYARMLQQIKGNQRRIISSILICVTMAIRPMTLEELKTAVSLLCNTSIDSSQTMRDRITSCGPILKTYDGQVSLVHQSARDYLLREEADDNPVLRGFQIKAEEAHASLARICLEHIEKSDFRHEMVDIVDQDESVLQETPLLYYAALVWPEHARRSLYADQDINLSRPFFQKKSNVRDHWWQAYSYAIRGWAVPASLPLLHIASYLGIDSLAWKILTTKDGRFNFRKPANRKDDYNNTALNLAASGGHKTTVQLLLARGADVNNKNSSGNTALIKAAEGEHEAIVQLLLASGADVNTKNNYGHTALSEAVREGNKAIVQLLLASGADANTKENSGHTALNEAAEKGHEAIVQILLANSAGTCINTKNYLGHTALSNAANKGHEAIVQLLLANGADVNTKDLRGDTALSGAAAKGDKAIVQLLLASGADSNIEDDFGNTALSEAAGRGHEAIVQILLASGADMNTKDRYGMTALDEAALRGHEAIVQILLANGADVNKYGRHRTLDMAIRGGNEAIVQLLRANGCS